MAESMDSNAWDDLDWNARILLSMRAARAALQEDSENPDLVAFIAHYGGALQADPVMAGREILSYAIGMAGVVFGNERDLRAMAGV